METTPGQDMVQVVNIHLGPSKAFEKHISSVRQATTESCEMEFAKNSDEYDEY